MNWFDSALLGLVEGITEFLPISSTGHLILASTLLHLEQSEFLKSFEVIIQLGSILAVVAVYWKRFFDIALLKKLFVAFLPTGIIGLALYKVVKAYLLGNEVVVLWALLLGGIALIVFELLHKEKEGAVADTANISYTQAASIGLFQALAIIPGTSRSAATIVGGLMLGLTRATIVEFSFLLAVPTMLAATGLDLIKTSAVFTADELGMLAIGFVISFGVALASIKFLLSYIRTHTFVPFGVYRIVVAIAFFFLVLY